jgi:hypothetical protein
MDVLKTLKDQRKQVEASRAEAVKVFDHEIADIDAAIDAIVARRQGEARGDSESAPPLKPKGVTGTGQISIDDAIIEAVKNGVHTPMTILTFLKDHLGIETTVNSIRTRVSRLGADDRLARDERGWILPSKSSDDRPTDENSNSGSDEEAAV